LAAFITVGFPSMVRLTGESPFVLSSVKKSTIAGILFSLRLYCPLIRVLFSLSKRITALIILFQIYEPSKTRYLVEGDILFVSSGYVPNHSLMISLILPMLFLLIFDI
jgi:hypothetical protein